MCLLMQCMSVTVLGFSVGVCFVLLMATAPMDFALVLMYTRLTTCRGSDIAMGYVVVVLVAAYCKLLFNPSTSVSGASCIVCSVSLSEGAAVFFY